jgi:hypothetical protein
MTKIRNRDYRLLIGAVITSLAVIGFAWLALVAEPPIWQLRLDEAATFIGGIFGPLALLWVVIGYLQQGEELRNSSEALRLQAEELHASVEQQRQLVETSKAQLESERESFREELIARGRRAQPVFFIERSSAGQRPDGSSLHAVVQIKNLGRDASRVTYHFEVDGKSLPGGTYYKLGHGEDGHFDTALPSNFRGKICLILDYLDAQLELGQVIFEGEISEEEGKVVFRIFPSN